MIKLRFRGSQKEVKSGATFQTFKTLTFELFRDRVTSVLPRLYAILKAIPGAVARPIDWTSRRQEIAFYASNGFGRGIPTHRTGRMAAGWTSDVTEESDGRFLWTLSNMVPESKFVYGALTKDVNKARRPQQRFHRATGWPLASPVVDMTVNNLKNDMASEVKSAEFKRRASQSRKKI